MWIGFRSWSTEQMLHPIEQHNLCFENNHWSQLIYGHVPRVVNTAIQKGSFYTAVHGWSHGVRSQCLQLCQKHATQLHNQPVYALIDICLQCASCQNKCEHLWSWGTIYCAYLTRKPLSNIRFASSITWDCRSNHTWSLVYLAYMQVQEVYLTTSLDQEGVKKAVQRVLGRVPWACLAEGSASIGVRSP